MEPEDEPAGIRPLRDLFHFHHFAEFYRLYVPMSLLIGVVCGLFMVAFQILIDAMGMLLSAVPLFLSPIVGGLFSSLLIYAGAREIEGSGISKAIELTHKPAELHARTAITKLMATSVSIGSGNPVGREGPAVLIGAAIGNAIGRKLGFDNPMHLRVLIMMGSAAATAGIYKAPLGGALFAAEAPYKRDARLGYFVPTVLASITSFIVFTLIMGVQPIFSFEAAFRFTLDVVPLLLLFGVVAGLVSIFFSVVLMTTRNIFRLYLPDWADPLAGSALVCIVLFLIGISMDPHLTVAGMGYDVINHIAVTQIPILLLAGLLIAKLFASSFVVGGKVSGGVLASSLFVGAMLGAIFGELFYPSLVPAFVVLGMGAVLASTTNTPIATVVMMLEMSLTFDLLIPLVICVCISYLTGVGTSLYEGQRLTRDDEPIPLYPEVGPLPDANLGINVSSENIRTDDDGTAKDDGR